MAVTYTLLHRIILLESLVSSNPLETLCETFQQHPRAKIAFLNFMGAAGLADSRDTDSQSHSTLSLKVFNEQNLMFLAGSFQKHAQLVLSENAAALKVTFGAKSTDVEDPNVVLVSIRMKLNHVLSVNESNSEDAKCLLSRTSQKSSIKSSSLSLANKQPGPAREQTFGSNAPPTGTLFSTRKIFQVQGGLVCKEMWRMSTIITWNPPTVITLASLNRVCVHVTTVIS